MCKVVRKSSNALFRGQIAWYNTDNKRAGCFILLSGNTQIPKTLVFSSRGGTSRGLAPWRVPFKQGVRSSNLRRVTKSSEHFGSMGQKPSDFKVFGIFYDRKFSNYSMDQWKRYRGSNRVWTSAFPFSRGFLQPAPFFRGLRRKKDPGKFTIRSVQAFRR